LVRRFKSGEEYIEVLKGVDICINEGDTVSIQGESGCGKSTLLNLMAGLDHADEGGIFWNSEEISKHSNQVLAIKRSSLIGMVFQSYYLVPEIRALENVMLGGRISGNTAL
jgi:ABC-type lipoprotein export system ATPase subunit